MGWSALELAGADLAYDPAWLAADAADALFAELRDALAWTRHRIRLFGREHEAPRLSCWLGDPQARYRYSGTVHEPAPWPSALQALLPRLRAACAAPFNSALANLYRDGRDAMGWHSDDEPELGPAPTIASLSLGAPRRFVLRHKREAGHRLALELGHGSLLLMRGDTQHNHRHALPRSARVAQPRLNLTFRSVVRN